MWAQTAKSTRSTDMDDSKLGYRVTEAAKAIGISVSKFKEEMYQGRVKYIKIGTCVVIPRGL